MAELVHAPLVLHSMPPMWACRSLSPFCTKLETWLLLAGVAYTLAPANPLASPKGKVPYVRDGETVVGDSQLVIEHLGRTRGVNLDAALSPDDAARCHLVRRTVEEASYFALAWHRWARPEAWPTQQAAFATLFPPGIRWVAPSMIRRRVVAAMRAQGTARHTPEEIGRMAIADWAAISSTLGDRPFFGGDTPATADATVYAFLDGALGYPVTSAMQDHVRGDERLARYRERMAERVKFPAWP